MNDFAAIDFETANSHRESVCSVGIVIVKNQKVSDTFYELIRPAPNYYCDWATEIHGLTYHDTAHADPFPVVWQKIAPVLTNWWHTTVRSTRVACGVFLNITECRIPTMSFSVRADNRAKYFRNYPITDWIR